MSTKHEVLACLSAASFHFAAGSVYGFSAILIPQLESPESDIKVDKDDISWIVRKARKVGLSMLEGYPMLSLASVVALVTPVSSLLSGPLVDRLGRLNTIRFAAVPYALGCLCMALTPDLPILLLGRFLTGFSLAMACNPALVYIAEVARPDYRGTLTCLGPSFMALGMVVVYTKGAFLYWRTMSWLAISYCLFPLLFMYLWSPESPAWLLSKGRTEDAKRSLCVLHGKLKTSDGEVPLPPEMMQPPQQSQQESFIFRFLRTMSRPNVLKAILLLAALFSFQQFSGIYVTIFYSVTFFKNVGATIDPYICTVGIGVVTLVSSTMTSFLLGRFGRRPLLILSGTGMTVFIFMSGYLSKEIAEGRIEGNFVPVVCILLYMILGVLGLMSIPWTMTAELFPLEVRGMAQGLMIAIANLLMFTVLKIYPFLGDALGGAFAVQWFFAAVSLTSVVYIYVFVPETHGRQLEEIQDYLKNNTIYFLRKETKKVPERENGEEMVALKHDNAEV